VEYLILLSACITALRYAILSTLPHPLKTFSCLLDRPAFTQSFCSLFLLIKDVFLLAKSNQKTAQELIANGENLMKVIYSQLYLRNFAASSVP
tara:strand:- start:147 stop:425 length:279 start_codon:yes stop_codon:yes gene_type:complete